jgi:hypothetical protein
MSEGIDGASDTAAPQSETPQERLERALFELQRALQEVLEASRAVGDV